MSDIDKAMVDLEKLKAIEENNSHRCCFGPIVWGRRGEGIDLEPSLRMWGIDLGTIFIGVLYKDRPTGSSNPVKRYYCTLKETNDAP
jgi:hypothetical protein